MRIFRIAVVFWARSLSISMGQFRILSTAAAMALCLAPAALARDSATTSGSADLQDRGGIEATGEVIFQNIVIIPSITLSPSIVTSSTGGANMSVIGDTTVSIAVPDTIDVSLDGGENSVIVLTAMDGGQAGLTGLNSLITPGEVLSIDIGGEIAIRPEDLAPGEYRGLLVVVAQYN